MKDEPYTFDELEVRLGNLRSHPMFFYGMKTNVLDLCISADSNGLRSLEIITTETKDSHQPISGKPITE